ncbi:MAG: hypothetical protein JXR68_03080 [Bacteroidales bacterium]|nr:hypothetical protein [Bacteroidales bacterium]
MKIKYLLFIFIIVALSSCLTQQNYPITPQIDFRQVIVTEVTDILGNRLLYMNLYFKILDGDGNFGFKDGDTLYENGDTISNNFLITMFYIYNGNIYEFQSDTLLLDGRIPWTNPVGLNEYYKATVIYDLPLSFSFTDSIKFSFYVIDNDLNRSNTQSTMWIPPNFRGVLVDSVNIIAD